VKVNLSVASWAIEYQTFSEMELGVTGLLALQPAKAATKGAGQRLNI